MGERIMLGYSCIRDLDGRKELVYKVACSRSALEGGGMQSVPVLKES